MVYSVHLSGPVAGAQVGEKVLQQNQLLAALARRPRGEPPLTSHPLPSPTPPAAPSPPSTPPSNFFTDNPQDGLLHSLAKQTAAESGNESGNETANEAVEEAGAGEEAADNTAGKVADNPSHEVRQPSPLLLHLPFCPLLTTEPARLNICRVCVGYPLGMSCGTYVMFLSCWVQVMS